MTDREILVSVSYQENTIHAGQALDIAMQPSAIPSSSISCAFSPDGSLLAVGHTSAPHITVIDTATWAIIDSTPTIRSQGNGCAFSPDGSLLAVAHFYDPGVTIIDTATWAIIDSTPAVPGHGNGCAFSPDGSLLAVAHHGAPYITVIDTATWTAIDSSAAGTGTGHACDFSPDGSVLAFGEAGNFKLFNTATWAEISHPLGRTGRVHSAKFSPNGAVVAISYNSYPYLSVLETATWSEVEVAAELSEGHGCAFSADGEKLAVLTYRAPYLFIIDTKTWSDTGLAHGLPNAADACTFSPTGMGYYRSVNAESDVRLIEPQSLSQIYTVESPGSRDMFMPKPGKYWLLMPDDSPGGIDQFAQIDFNANSSSLEALVLRRQYTGDLATISSNLSTQAGAAGDEVVIRDWNTRELVAKITPESSGDWVAQVPPGKYDVSYLADGCAPVIHGPYTVELPVP